MPDKRYIELNGSYYLSNEPVLYCNNRAFLYGDALFESMVSFNGKIPFIKDHISRLKRSMEILKMRVPFQFSDVFFKDRIESLLRKNKFFKGVRIRITVFRNEGGLYSPSTSEVSYLIDTFPLDNNRYTINNNGFIIDIFKEHLKPVNTFSSVKSTNDLLFIMAGIFRKENNLDECIILNQHKCICETMSSNIFLVKNNSIYTPSLQSGCLQGIMRKRVIEICINNKIELEEVINLTVEHLEEADECFITNAVNGIRWIVGFRQGRYFNKISVFLTNELNKLVEKV